jgi:chemotaxis response regulator CheB
VSVTAVVDDYALAAVPGLDADLARAGALVMRSFRGTPSPHLLRGQPGVAVVGGPDRAGLVARLERATATVAAPVVGILPTGVAPEPALRGPGVVDLVPASASGIAARVLLMAQVPVVSPGRRLAPPLPSPRATARAATAPPLVGAAREGLGAASEVIAFASSTGGVWVLADALRALPRDGRAVLVAQHLEAEFVPFFAEWLGSVTGWCVAVVDAPVALAAGVVYVPAGGRDLVLGGRAAVEAPPASSRFVPSGDRLLASVAAAGLDATGVVLSGMGGDGAEGLATLARRGGIALCQAPASAAVPSMPEAALARSRAVIPVPPEALAAAIGARQGDARTSPSARR